MTTIDLTLEQQLRLRIYASQAQSLSVEEARVLLVELMRQNMIKDNVIKSLLNSNQNE
ncbi:MULTISPECIES: NblA/ycf18 family protein [unclassified Microcoleus]|uniref:NblA/ycf18 family protein n=1 Tax=unclassified Microcoleus TaxID=2642155 RepID=UPI002FD6E860